MRLESRSWNVPTWSSDTWRHGDMEGVIRTGSSSSSDGHASTVHLDGVMERGVFRRERQPKVKFMAKRSRWW